ncbi:class II aldolase/adducin family protein [Domibacillus indicus]|uniref:class II aldolase/adducin family protein n=1 Tax=Domibacillus indicus TaxID=1437523 RepID=UPI00203DE7D6|nr:class II aldolase/adducin family protein [Domibacillus indicus]MCM3790699.1 class II aldolase/adducin family protein [Domibacillus indicus]
MKTNIHPAEQIVSIMERIYKYEMTTISGGNLSLIDENGDMWITPSGVDKGNLTVRDIMRLKKDGTAEGIHTPSVELPFHQGIYEVRPDIKAIVHAHPPALVSFSMARKKPNAKLFMNTYKHIAGSMEIAAYAIPGSEALKNNIASQFAKGGSAVIMENHGLVVGGTNLFEAFHLFEMLEYLARIEINANTIGKTFELTEEQLKKVNDSGAKQLPVQEKHSQTEEEAQARAAIVQFLKRLYDRKLITSKMGSLSVKLSDGSILVTPAHTDRKLISTQDIVHLKEGKCEALKEPCEFYELHEKMYKEHPEISSAAVVAPPYLMAYAITEARYNTHIIPEAYVVLRDIGKVPFDTGSDHYKAVAKKIADNNPVLLVENGYAVVTGGNLLKVFDRIEVAEYSAKALVQAKHVGEVINIREEDIDAIIQGFKLSAKS